jgi:hypothetical protein
MPESRAKSAKSGISFCTSAYSGNLAIASSKWVDVIYRYDEGASNIPR